VTRDTGGDPIISEACISIAADPVGDSVMSRPEAPRDPWARWERRGELGFGGMGRVLLVFDRVLGREVALKEPFTLSGVRRLEREALLTARLEHPGIVPVYDAGVSPDGRPWFVMRVVRGRSLAERLAETASPETRRELLRPLLSVCQTLAFAHDAGVVHRDLKPANIMIGAFGQTQVIDWGLALSDALPAPGEGSEEGSDALEAKHGTGGTPRYMSPEQARGEPVGPASDVFSLGAILFEVLTGAPLFPQPTRREVLDLLRRGEIPAVTEAAHALPTDLAALLQRALHPDAARRYPDAEALAEDLARYLDGRRVSAHEYTAGELLRRLVHAWRRPLAVAGVALALLIAVVVVAFARIAAERTAAEQSLAVALAAAAAAAAQADARGEAELLAAAALARAPSPEARGVLAALPEPRPSLTRAAPPPCSVVEVAGERSLCVDGGVVSVHEGGRELWRRPLAIVAGPVFIDGGGALVITSDGVAEVIAGDDGSVLAAWPHRGCFTGLLPSGDPRVALMASRDCFARVGPDLHDVVHKDAVCPGPGVATAALHPDGERFAVSCLDEGLVVGRFDTGEVIRFDVAGARLAGVVSALAFAPGGDDLIAGLRGGDLVRLEAPTYLPGIRLPGRGLVHRLLVDPQRGRVAALRDQGAPLLVDAHAFVSLGRVPGVRPVAAAFDASGRLRAVGSHDDRWDFAGVLPRALELGGGIPTLSFSPSGGLLAVGHGTELTVFDVPTRRPVARDAWDDVLAKDVRFVPDPAPGGDVVLLYGVGRAAVVRYGPEGPLQRGPARSVASTRRLGVAADGRALAATWQGLMLEDAEAGGWRRLDGPGFLRDLAVSADGEVTAGVDARGVLWRGEGLHRGGAITPCGEAVGGRAVAICPETHGLYWLAPDAVRPGCDAADVAMSYLAPGGDLLVFAVSAGWVAAGDRDGRVRLWRRGDPSPRAIHVAHDGRVGALAFSPGGAWLASGGWDGRLAFFAPPEGSPPHPALVESAWGLSQTELFRFPRETPGHGRGRRGPP